MSGWKSKKISSFATISTGNKDTQDKVENGNFPFFVRSQNIERINSYSFEGPAVLTAGDGVGVGKVFHLVDEKFDFHQRVYKISDFSDEILPKYFFYLFSKDFYRQVMRYTAKGSVDSVRMEMISEMLVDIPPLNEQQKIVEILSDCDTAIENASLLAVSQEQALNAEINKAIQRTSSNFVSLSSLVTLSKGQKVIISENGDGQPYLGSQALKGNILNFSEDDNGLTCAPSDVLLLWDGENAGRASTNLEGIVSSTVMRLRPNNPTLNEFISGILRNNFKRIQAMREGSGVPHLPTDFIRRFKLPDIDISQQIEIGNYFAEARAVREIAQKKVDLLKKQKRGLMQQLLTGKLRVKGAA